MIDNNILNAFISMAVIVLVLVAVLIFLKRLAKKKQDGGSGIGMKILSRQALQHKAQAVVVQVRGRILLLGLTEHNVSLLADLTEEESIVPREDIEKVFPTSNKNMQESLRKAAGNDHNTQQDLSFKAFIKNAFSKGV